ncbi:crAss001_48 related protein [Limosilactobacillus reuteri]|uniref:crAss001_48 related protein n=1 Tax=Limosilactobacillus reuteri TaxID=1598 RepID=UPI002B052293|nr:hypothetical protein [Limosilactobacillus reuteri]
MTIEEVLNDFKKKIKSGEYQIVNVCRGNNDGVQHFDFTIASQNNPMHIALKLLKENAEIAGKMFRLEKFMKTDEYAELSDKERRLMIIQYNAIQVYADTLLQRIDEIKERM